MEGSSALRTCPKCGVSEDLRDSAFCPNCGAVLRAEHPPHSLHPLSEAPDTEQSGSPHFADEASATIAEDGEPPSLQFARASGLEKSMPTPAEPKIEEAAPPPFMRAPERLSAPESWLRPSSPASAAPKGDAAATSLAEKPPVMTGAVRAAAEAVGEAARPADKPIEKTVEDIADEAKQALADLEKEKPKPLPKGTTAPHMLPGHEAVQKMLSIPAGPALPIGILQALGRLALAGLLSALAAIGYGFVRERVGPDLVKALSLNPRGPVLDIAFGALFLLTSFAFGYGVFRATSQGWRTPKWRKV
ncbi:MAG: hypothetical protein U0414_10305 [Polyangiaceae bacterium]